MKVLLINGSPHKEGCTYTALSVVAKAVEAAGIETEIFQTGPDMGRGCMGCGYCAKNGKCVCNDRVNDVLEKIKEADGIVVGSPVHYASASGQITGFMDRLFYAGGKYLCHKPGAAVVSCRRGGSTAALDQLNKYFAFNNMPVVSSRYWNMVHGSKPEEVLQDKEGIQIMETLGLNMAWLIKAIEAGKQAGIEPPVLGDKIKTSFIR